MGSIIHVTDSAGKIYIEQKLTKDMIIQAEIDGKKITVTVSGDKVVVTVPSTGTQNNTGLIIAIIVIVLGGIGFGGYLYWKKRK